MPSSKTAPLPPGGVETLPPDRLGALLADARERTLTLVADICDDDLDRVHDPLMSPLVWDLGHIAAFEDLWIGVNSAGLDPLRGDLMTVYDAAETPRVERGDLPYLRRAEVADYLQRVRERTLAVLARTPEPGPIWDMVVQHEHQHGETMLQTMQLAESGTCAPARRPARGIAASGTVEVPAGQFALGASPGTEDRFVYDNELPARERELAAFRIDRAPVTNGAYREFVADGGYERRSLWSEHGWALREREGWERPLYWTRDGGERRFDRLEPIEDQLPAMHVSWYEADAFARWAGRRLPTEAQWERAAREHAGASGNIDQLDFGPGPAGPFVGDCWEWTASDFGPYPGFRAWPYPEYSEVFFGGGYKVLRGGSWATRPRVARETFRNWDHPQRRQIFASFRLVDA